MVRPFCDAACNKHMRNVSFGTFVAWIPIHKTFLIVLYSLACFVSSFFSVACSYRASAAVLDCLVQAYPEAVAMAWSSSPSSSYPRPRYPLHLLTGYGHADVNAFVALLKTPLGVSITTRPDPLYGVKPLEVWNLRKNLNVCQTRRNRMRTGLLLHQQPEPSSSSSLESWQAELDNYRYTHFWKIASVLLVAEYEQTPLVVVMKQSDASSSHSPPNDNTITTQDDVLDNQPLRVVRAALCHCHCPPSLQEYAILVYQPILFALYHPCPPNETTSNGCQVNAINKIHDTMDGTPLHWAARHATTQGFQLVWQCMGFRIKNTHANQYDPAATAAASCRRQSDGALPLELALQNPNLVSSSSADEADGGSCWWKLLVQAYPPAVADLVQFVPPPQEQDDSVSAGTSTVVPARNHSRHHKSLCSVLPWLLEKWAQQHSSCARATVASSTPDYCDPASSQTRSTTLFGLVRSLVPTIVT